MLPVADVQDHGMIEQQPDQHNDVKSCEQVGCGEMIKVVRTTSMSRSEGIDAAQGVSDFQ
jgi:hypothetical protein